MNKATIDILLRLKDQASRPVQRTLRQINRNVQRTTRLLLRLGAGASAAAVGFGYMASKAIDSADRIAKVAEKVGLSTDALQELRYAADLAGVGTQTLDMAMQRFSRRVAEAAQGQGELQGVLEQYGIQVTDAQGRTRALEDVLGDLADAIRNAESDQERLRIAFKAFDSEGAALVNMLKDGGGALDAMRARAHELGIVLREDLLRGAEGTNDRLSILGTVIQSKVTAALLKLSPVIDAAADSLLNIARRIDIIVDEDKLKEWADRAGPAIEGAFDKALGIVKDLKEPLSDVAKIMAGMVAVWQRLPKWVQTTGLIVAFLGGTWGRVLLIMLSAIGMGIDALFEKMETLRKKAEFFSRLEREGYQGEYGYAEGKAFTKPPLTLPEPPPPQGSKLRFVGSMKRPDSIVAGAGMTSFLTYLRKYDEAQAKAVEAIEQRRFETQQKLRLQQYEELVAAEKEWADSIALIPKRLAEVETAHSEMAQVVTSLYTDLSRGVGEAFADMLLEGRSFADRMKALFRDITRSAISYFVSLGFTHLFPAPTPVPAMAAGGIVTRPTLALVGESGPEAVIPLRRLGREGAGAGKTEVNITNRVVVYSAMSDADRAELLSAVDLTTRAAVHEALTMDPGVRRKVRRLGRR